MKDLEREPLMRSSNTSRLQLSRVEAIPERTWKVSIHRGSLKFVNANLAPESSKSEQRDISALQSYEKFTGRLSSGSKAKVTRIINNWVDSIFIYNSSPRKGFRKKKRKLVMITLTLSRPQFESDEDVKRNLLNKFLTYLRRSHPHTLYLWKAEKQKNGNLHFHIIADNYISKEWVRLSWNSLQEKYFDYFFEDKSDRDSLWPSTQVEAIRDISKGASYLIDYITKEEDKIIVDGRLWSCSRELTSLNSLSFITSTSQIIKILGGIDNEGALIDPSGFFAFVFFKKRFTHAEFVSKFSHLAQFSTADVFDDYVNALMSQAPTLL